MSQAAAKHFIAQGNGGKIINIASMLSFQGGIRVPSYTASKSAVMGVTRLLANDGRNTTSTSTRLRRAIWRPTTPSSCA
jgi:NAD(P)-dependent dehydrogenase (short-subunit alcohol dehydrogenase family)